MMPRKYAASCWLAVVMGLWIPRPGAAAWLLSTVDAPQPVRVTVNSLSVKNGLSYTTDDGQLHQTPTRELVRLVSDQNQTATGTTATSDAATGWLLRLRDGDLIVGTPVELKQAALHFQTEDLGGIDVPLRLIEALVRPAAQAEVRPGAADHDTLQLKNGDTLAGVLIGLADGKATLQSDLGDTPVDLARVNALILGGAQPARAAPKLAFRLTLSSGAVLTTADVVWATDTLTFEDPGGAEHHTPIERVARLEVLGGRLVRLTALDPVQAQQTSYLSGPWPVRTDQNVVGGPLRVAGRSYDRGLGVHTDSRLVYNLDGSFTTLAFGVGLDDSAQPYGIADLAVVVDGRTVWEAKAQKPGSLQQAKVAIAGGRTLELRATSPSGVNVLGRVDWIEPVFIRP